jgi:hypothetical protein
MKLCKDCKHCRVETAWLTRHKFYYCTKEVHESVSPVTGGTVTVGNEVRCSIARSIGLSDGGCGVEGKYWEPK